VDQRARHEPSHEPPTGAPDEHSSVDAAGDERRRCPSGSHLADAALAKEQTVAFELDLEHLVPELAAQRPRALSEAAELLAQRTHEAESPPLAHAAIVHPRTRSREPLGARARCGYNLCAVCAFHRTGPIHVAVTGATGFIGRYMVRALSKAGHRVRVLARPGREGAVEHPPEGKVEIHTGDLTTPSSLEGFLRDIDLLIHIASAHDHLGDEQMQKINIKGTEALLDCARREAAKDFQIWIVSSAVIGAPVYSYYRDSKRVQEKLIKGSGFEWASFRPTLVYGVGDYRHTAPLLRKCAARSGSFWVPHDGLSKINPVHVEDVVDAVMRYFSFERGIDCVYELAGPAGIAYNDFVDHTIRAAGGGLRRRNLSKKWADRLIFLKGIFVDNTADRRASAYFNLHHEHDITNAKFELGWEPRPYAQGIAEVAQGDWWRSEGPSA
jgi:nucleoside-diphosphate-sugar epimerase